MEDDTRFSHPAEPRRRKHFGFVVKSINPIAWKSPSTASTSSLAQLHEKLAALPRYRYDKDTVSVCVKPQLSSVSEVSETEEKQSFDTASTIVLTPRCYQRSGVRSFVKTRNLDSESVKNSSRGENYLSTVAVDEDDSANSLLAAALCTTENSIINDSLERLPRDQNFKTDNIVDLLIKEALDREVEVRQGVLDSEINTGDIGRKTQNLQEMDSEAIENTPCIEDNKEVLSVEKNKNPKVNKFTVVSNSTSTDDSTLEDVNVSNVTHRRKMMKNSNIDPFICDQNNEYNFTHDENQTSKIEVVEDYFSKHFSENKTDDLIIRPTLAKRINDTSSEGDNINQEYFHMNKDFNVKDDQFNVKDIEIIDCLNNIVDKVCNELDRIECVIQENTEFKKSEFSDVVPKDGLTTQSINDLELKNKKENKISKETMSKSIESIKLKYTAPKKKEKTFKTKKVAKKSKNKSIKNIPKTDDKLDKNNIVASESAKINDKSIVHNLRSANTKVISENNKEVTPTNIVNESETPVTIRRKRKLYSPKDEQTAIDNWAIQIPETEDSTVVASEKDKDSTVFTDIKTYKRTSKITSKSVATCYKDIEVERQRIRLPRERKATYKVPPMQSSRTKKINDMFDKLKKNNENNEKIIIADRKSIQDDVAIYNYTSDSEDEDFKKKKIEIRNRFSITNLGSATSTMSTRHGRLTNRVNYTENNASSSHASKIKKLKEKRTKTVKHEKAKSKTRKVNLEPTNDLVDEKMREAALEVLNTSLVIERSVEKDLQEQEPKLLLPQMELISDDNAESVRNTTLERKKLNKRNKLDKALSLRRDNGQNKTDTVIRKNEDNRSISPLPGLVIETVQMPHEDPDDSVSTNILQKFKKIYREDPDPSVNVSNTTQNLLYDIDKVNYSPRNEMYNDKMSETVILSQINEDSDACIENPKEKNRNAKSKNKIDNINICSNKSEKSIATVGNSPITAHGNFDEAPPNSDLLKQKLKPRNMELEDLDKSMKEYFIELTEATNINSINDDLHPYYTRLDKLKTDQKFEVNEQPKCDDMADKNSPSVVLSRLSSDEIRKWLPSRHTSVTDNSNSSEVTIKTRKSRMKLDFRSTKKVTPKKKKKENQETTENRKSIISPIKLFEDLIPKSQISHFSDLCDKDAGRHIKNILSNSMNKNTNTNLLKSTPDDLELSADFKTSTSSRIENSNTSYKTTVKRKSSTESSDIKRSKIKNRTNNDIILSVSESGPSISSVNDWFRRNQPSECEEEGIDLSIKESIQNVLEKLDTTLVEIHQKTSKSFVHMFMDVQEQLANLRQQRYELYKQTANEMLGEMVKLLDTKFVALDKRTQEIDNEFKETLKKRASELIREDCNQKRCMVLLLREDLQAMMIHTQRKRREEDPSYKV